MGVPGPKSKLSTRAPTQMGRRETVHERGKRQPKKGKHAAFVLPRAQVGCACSRGVTSVREGEREGSSANPFSRTTNLLVREPWTFLL
jgi:hypothetical protein